MVRSLDADSTIGGEAEFPFIFHFQREVPLRWPLADYKGKYLYLISSEPSPITPFPLHSSCKALSPSVKTKTIQKRFDPLHQLYFWGNGMDRVD